MDVCDRAIVRIGLAVPAFCLLQPRKMLKPMNSMCRCVDAVKDKSLQVTAALSSVISPVHASCSPGFLTSHQLRFKIL